MIGAPFRIFSKLPPITRSVIHSPYSFCVETLSLIESKIDLILDLLDQIDLFELDNDYRIKVIVAKIINHFDYQENVITLNNYISSNVEDRFKDGDYIFLADFYSSLNDEKYFLDNVHPNESGYKVMAETWASKI